MTTQATETNQGLEETLAAYAEMIVRKELFLTEKIGLTDRERKFAVSVISKSVYELKEYARREQRARELKDETEYYPGQNERNIGYGYGQRNAARDIAGSSLSSLFGGMGIDTINALEALAEREDIHHFCPIIVEEYYRELEKQWKR
jgi:hypothetical protein